MGCNLFSLDPPKLRQLGGYFFVRKKGTLARVIPSKIALEKAVKSKK